MSGSSGLESSVTLEEVFTVLATKRVPLAPELAGYLVLEVAEHAHPGGGDIDPRSVFIGEEGTVALVKPRREGVSGSAEESVRAMLGRLLEVSGSQTPALAAASRRKGGPGLPALAEELETALIPVNRAAGRRALARLAREVRRVTLGVGRNALPSSSDVSGPPRRALSSSHGPLSEPPSSGTPANAAPPDEDPTTTKRPIPNEILERASPSHDASSFAASAADVDALLDQFGAPAANAQQHAGALKAMAEIEPTPVPPAQPRRESDVADKAEGSRHPPGSKAEGSRHPPSSSDVDALLALGAEPVAAESRRPPPAVESRPPQPVPESRRPSPLDRPPHSARVSSSHVARPKPTRFLPAVGLIVVAGGAFAVWAVARRAPAMARPAAPLPTQNAMPEHTTKAPAVCRGMLVVTNVPERAEVLVRQGQAPVDVEKMPVGARLEFVATAEGYAPKRVVVPATAGWDTGPDGKPRLETAIQLDKAKAGAETWPPSEPGSEVGGLGAPGTIHVVSTPRGAEIWLLAGLGPEAHIDKIRCDRDVDVLVAGPAAYRKRIHVSPHDFRSEGPDAPHVARVGAK